MPRRGLIVALMLVAAACTGSGGVTTTTPAAGTAVTTTTLAPAPARDGMTPVPELILAAADSHEISSLESDLFLTWAMFSVPEAIPLEYFAVDPVPRPQWDHSATTRLVEMWDELDGEVQVELLDAIDGLDELVDRPGVEGIRSSRGEGCIPVAGTDVLVCVGESVTDNPVPDLPLEEAVTAVRPWIRDAAGDAWPRFEALMGGRPFLVKVFLSNLTANGGYTYGVVPGEQPGGGVCHVYVDVMIPEETDAGIVHLGDAAAPDGVPRVSQLKATLTHELFHCFQRATLPSFDRTLWEASATWAEHHVYPEENTEIPWMTTWVSDPDRPFAVRVYDPSFALVYADLKGAGSGVIADVLKANSIAELDPDFETVWHDISVSAWNRVPVDVLLNNGGEPIPATVDDLGTMGITSDAEETLDFTLPLYSRDLQTFEFFGGTSERELADFARLRLDLSAVPSDVRISAIPETTGGWLEPLRLTGPEWQFCRAPIGPCNDAETINPYTRIVIITTNIDNGIETFSIPWETYNPHLDGTWIRTQGPLFTTAASPYWIAGTELTFDEGGLVMGEDSAGYALTNAESGWECTFAGFYSRGADPEYGPTEGGNVSGTVTVAGGGEGETFTNDCVFTGPGGRETRTSGVHVPVASSPTQTFGFEIRDHDTVWIYAFERVYVYERAGEP